MSSLTHVFLKGSYACAGHIQQFSRLQISASKLACVCHHRTSAYTRQHGIYFIQARHMSQRNFFGELFENIKQEFTKNKEMKENLKKFREEAQKLEESEALQKAREKYQKIEQETSKGSEVLKEQLGELKEKLQEGWDEARKNEVLKRGMEIGESVGKTATKAAQAVSRQGEQLGKSAAFKNISEGVKAVKEELDEHTLKRSRPYRAPEKLKKRQELSSTVAKEEKTFDADTESMGMVMHKDSRFYQSWQNFKDNNPYVHKMFDLKTKYDESDNLMIRLTRTFTDKVGQVFGGMFSKTEMSEVLTEICKMDPNFDQEEFIRECQFVIIPNVLEAMVRGDLDILQDWCHEAPFNVLATPIRQAKQCGYTFHSHVLDVNNVDVMAGKMMEQGPVLIISFHSQQIQVVKNMKGEVVEGNPDAILKVLYVWALCRDQTVLDPKAAWKLMDISASSAEQWL